jgi:SAM-dependent methyltransferase
MMNDTFACPVCGGSRFNALPSPWPFSMTTAGLLISEPLAKEQCAACGMLVRSVRCTLAQTDFYEKNYAFFDRPGAALFDRPRYDAMAAWISEALDGYEPASILDAGCGRGWMMRALRDRYSQATFHGVEPSEQESEIARREGWLVDTARVDGRYAINRRYDLVYCTNVVEHTTHPAGFLTTLRELTAPGGRIVVTCPDASYPNAEFMFSDQKFSFTPSHLQRIAEQAGLHSLSWRSAPPVHSLHDKQLWVFGTEPTERPGVEGGFRDVNPDQLFRERVDYVQSYVKCDIYLEESIRACRRVYNFGTSTWSLLLRAYCPAYWQRVTSCVIDGGYGQFQDKSVEDFRTIQIDREDAMVLGVNPYTQTEFAARLGQVGLLTIGWSHIIER